MPAELTSREIQLVALCAQGMSDKEVAQSLSLSVQTVATYWKRLKRRLNAGNRSEVIAMTLRGEVGIDRAAEFWGFLAWQSLRSRIFQFVMEEAGVHRGIAYPGWAGLSCRFVGWDRDLFAGLRVAVAI